MAANTENGGGRRGGRWRMAAWAVAALILLAPLVFSDEVNWTASDFVFAGVLLFGSLGIYELMARKTGDTVYRFAVGVAVAAAFLLIWVNGAVGITDSDADGMYVGVLAVGFIGALLARFRPLGMALAMFATALALVSVSVIALVAGIVPAFNSAFEILGITGFYVTLFVGSALLFRKAARGGPERGAV